MYVDLHTLLSISDLLKYAKYATASDANKPTSQQVSK